MLNRNIPASARALLAPTFGVTWLDTSPTEDERGVASALDECQADLVFFDNSGTGRQCRHAKRLGARTVFLSTRDRTLARGFGLDWLPWLDEHWIVGPRALAAPLSPWRRVTAAMSGTAVRSLQSVFTTTDAPRAAQLRHALGCPDGRYVCVVPGGGGGLIDGTAAAVIFADAAARVARRAGVPCVLLLGPLYEGADLTRPGVVVHLASHVQTVDLIAGAHVVVLGASSSLFQVCVASCSGGYEQLPRARAWAAQGVVAAADPTPDALADVACALLTDDARWAALQRRVDALAVENDLPRALSAIAGLLAPRA